MNVGTFTRYATKKSLRQAVAVQAVNCFGTSIFEPLSDGRHIAVGPDVLRDRRWYAQVDVVDGMIVKVVS